MMSQRPLLPIVLVAIGAAILFEPLGAQSVSTSAGGFRAPPRAQFTAEQHRVLSQLANHLSIVFLDDGAGNLVNKTFRLGGVNFQVVNDQGTTATASGVGNLIVGYNELGNPFGDDRTGSHNIVVGSEHSYNKWGGLAAGRKNTISGGFASVAGGSCNTASALEASVIGGRSNKASGESSSVSGGLGNYASGSRSSVSGGSYNTSIGNSASVSGGVYRSVAGYADWRAGSLFEDS